MSKDKFQIAYDGTAVREGTMDVYELAPALLSIGDLIRDVNRFLNQDRVSVSVQVESDFQKGSFEISILIDQSIVETAKHVLFGNGIAEAKQLLELIFGHEFITGGVVYGLIRLYKMLKGKKPEPAAVSIVDNSTTIINDIKVDSRTAQLYLSDPIRSGVDKTLRPIARAGIDKIQIRREKRVIEEINKSDLPERVLESAHSSSEQVLSDVREALLQVVKVDFDKGKWKFSDGTIKFSASVEDPVFLQKLENREIGFYKGDVLRVNLRTEQVVKTNGKFQSNYIIKEVLEYRPAPTQSPLLNP